MEKEVQMKAFANESEFDKAYEDFLAGCLQKAGREVVDSHAKMERSFQSYLDAFEKWVFRNAYEGGYAAALAGAADARGQGCRNGGGKEAVMEQLRGEPCRRSGKLRSGSCMKSMERRRWRGN